MVFGVEGDDAEVDVDAAEDEVESDAGEDVGESEEGFECSAGEVRGDLSPELGGETRRRC